MSRNTNIDLRKLFLYQVYLRNHTEEGTFKAFSSDLDRIKDLGVDVVYFLPIHPVGQKNKKGTLGCPYSIQDFRETNTEYGSIEDFKELIDQIHAKGMQCMIDVVYNHTSYDSELIKKHPEYFYKRDGEFANRVGDWWDITDFDYSVSKDLWVELIDTLVFWAKLGVDGYRFDVASLLPLEFLEEAHNAVLAVNPDFVFLSESVHGSFLKHIRDRGFEALSESEIYQVFDMAYDYDTHPAFEGYLKGENPLNDYLKDTLNQEMIYPQNYIKMRNLENHDFGRFAKMVDSNPEKIDQWTAFMFFNKGCTMMYGGQEFSDTNLPSLFDRDLVNWEGRDISSLVKKVSSIVKDDIFVHGVFDIELQDKDVIVASFKNDDKTVIGVFNVGNDQGYATSKYFKPGTYTNLLNNESVKVVEDCIELKDYPIIIEVK